MSDDGVAKFAYEIVGVGFACVNCHVEHSFDDGAWAHVAGISATSMHFCPKCKGMLAVGLDWATEHYDGKGSLGESIACAWAFQFGQYSAHPDFRVQLEHYLDDPAVDDPAHNNMLGPHFCAPQTWGHYGWSRWSDVRRAADEQQAAYRSGVAMRGTILMMTDPLDLQPQIGEFVRRDASLETMVRRCEVGDPRCIGRVQGVSAHPYQVYVALLDHSLEHLAHVQSAAVAVYETTAEATHSSGFDALVALARATTPPHEEQRTQAPCFNCGTVHVGVPCPGWPRDPPHAGTRSVFDDDPRDED